MLNFSYYLHERAEESRHNEAMSLLITVIGSVFLIGGIHLTLVTTQNPQWLLIFPYSSSSSAHMIWSLGLTLLGAVLFLIGIILAVHYAAQRTWYSASLKEIYRLEEEKMTAQKRRQAETEIPAFSNAIEPREDRLTIDIGESPPEFEKTIGKKT